MISKIILLIFLLTNVSMVISWHGSIDYDFTTNLKDEYNLFESSFSERDYFTLLSSKRNNDFDLNDPSKSSIMIGARLDLFEFFLKWNVVSVVYFNCFIFVRNNLYELKVPELKLIQNQIWQSSTMDVMKCLNRSIVNNKVILFGIFQH
jgi:hypothetical protein